MKPHIWYKAGFWHCGFPGVNPVGVSHANAHVAYWRWMVQVVGIRE